MSPDRESLELAAKAMGYLLPNKGDHDEIGRQYGSELGLWVGFDFGEWDWFRPHLSDAQALRMAVRLELPISPYTTYVMVGNQHAEFEGRDRMMVVRNTIVRAAAEIGRAMQ